MFKMRSGSDENEISPAEFIIYARYWILQSALIHDWKKDEFDKQDVSRLTVVAVFLCGSCMVVYKTATLNWCGGL